MSDTFYSGMADTATSLITKFGKPITFKRTLGGTRDPVTGATTSGIPQTFTPNGIYQSIRHDQIDGTLIRSGDKMIIIDASFTPELSDKVLVSSKQWSIINITEKNPAGVPLAYVVQARK